MTCIKHLMQSSMLLLQIVDEFKIKSLYIKKKFISASTKVIFFFLNTLILGLQPSRIVLTFSI